MDNPTQSLPEATEAPREAVALGPLAKGLGWFSIALGIAEIVMPKRIAQACGLRQHGALVRLYGLREIATGVGLLRSADATPWLWARVGGDMLDMATVATDRSRRVPLTRTGATLANLATVAAVDLYAANAYRGPRPRLGIEYPDYRDRSGFPRPAEEMRGVARGDAGKARAASSTA